MFKSLRRFNFFMAAMHGAQAVLMIALSKDFKLPITVGYLTFNQNTQSLDLAGKTIVQLPLVYLVAGFLVISSLAHLIISTIYNNRYNIDLEKGINKARWVEYSLSASTMMVAIAMLVGIYDLGSLMMLFALVAGMNLMGLVMEVYNRSNSGSETGKSNFLAFWIGCILGAIPWLVVALYFYSSAKYGSGNIPTFVYWIYISIFVFFNCFAVNMWLQYKKIGPWKNYIYGERVYIVLSLVAKSLLAWQVFAGTLRP